MAVPSIEKILIVDDDEDTLNIVKYCLEDISGIETLYAISGEEAIHKALDQKPSLIVLDIMMPGMDGVATLQAMKLIPSLASIPVIFFTADVEESHMMHYLSLGALGAITKPFDPLTFYNQITNLWDKYQIAIKKPN